MLATPNAGEQVRFWSIRSASTGRAKGTIRRSPARVAKIGLGAAVPRHDGAFHVFSDDGVTGLDDGGKLYHGVRVVFALRAGAVVGKALGSHRATPA
ncbi:hypothetical protein PEC18_30290 [Paucibacter sp. O1-1]|nr:hypothetical protein [Paucibacter sp. O1-1]MDA3830007.1 hypothetical protein [Paucibacter sp. O1-1]